MDRVIFKPVHQKKQVFIWACEIWQNSHCEVFGTMVCQSTPRQWTIEMKIGFWISLAQDLL